MCLVGHSSAETFALDLKPQCEQPYIQSCNKCRNSLDARNAQLANPLEATTTTKQNFLHRNLRLDTAEDIDYFFDCGPEEPKNIF